MILQQDNAPSQQAKVHTGIQQGYRTCIHTLENRSPKSPDLNSHDFGVWGVLKERVYVRCFVSTDELNTIITEEFAALSQSLINRAIDSWRKRQQLVVRNNGGHIEHVTVIQIRLLFIYELSA